MNLFLFCVMFFIKKWSFPAETVVIGVQLCTFIVLHGYFSLGKTSGPTIKAAGSDKALL